MPRVGDGARPEHDPVPGDGGEGSGGWFRRGLLLAVGVASGIATGITTGSWVDGVAVGAAVLSAVEDLVRP